MQEKSINHFPENLGFVFFAGAVFFMVSGDLPKIHGLGVVGPILNVFSWRSLYIILFSSSFLILIANQGVSCETLAEIKFFMFSLAGVLITFFISSLASQEVWLSLRAFLLFIGCLFFFSLCYIFLDSFTRRQLSLVHGCIFGGILLLEMATLYWRFKEGISTPAFVIGSNNWYGKNQIANNLVLFLPLIFAMGTSHGTTLRLVSLTVCLTGIVCIFLLQSRVGALSVFISAIVFFCRRPTRLTKPVLVMALCGAGVGVLWFLRNQPEARLNASELFKKLFDKSTHWNAAIRMFWDHPFTGIGLGTIDRITFTRYDFNFPNNWVYQFKDHGFHPHNLFLYILAETGLLGEISFLWFWISLIAHIMRTKHENSAAFLASFSGFLTFAMFDVLVAVRNFASLRSNLALWFLIALAIRELKRERHSLPRHLI